MPFSIIISTTILVIISLMLIVCVLYQNPKDENYQAPGTMGLQNLVGVVRAANLIEQITYMLASLGIIFVLLTSFLIKQHYAPNKKSAVIEHLEQYDTSKSDI